MEALKRRLEKYFDEFIVDEVQDIAGRDFSFLEQLMATNINMLFVGDFYQHTYDTSRDGNVNKNLFDNFPSYEARFINQGFSSDRTSLVKVGAVVPAFAVLLQRIWALRYILTRTQQWVAKRAIYFSSLNKPR